MLQYTLRFLESTGARGGLSDCLRTYGGSSSLTWQWLLLSGEYEIAININSKAWIDFESILLFKESADYSASLNGSTLA